jgi:biotin-dependent carboxylase-like uncharacterized protein
MAIGGSSRPIFRVISSGLLSTLQDLGRVGYQRLGISPCGAMDPLALRLANRLVGNAEGLGCLEITLAGLQLETLSPCQIAVTGADLSAQADGQPIALWTSCLFSAGQRLSLRKTRSGMRAYLAVRGGFSADEVLGSQSTDLRNGWGGFGGRSLRKGDLLFQAEQTREFDSLPSRTVRPEILWEYRDPFLLRVLTGPQLGLFPGESVSQFLGQEFRLHPSSNRMAYRLEGPRIPALVAEIISDAVPKGGIQVLPDGQLVLLMADHQTVGGYPKIGVLISADVPKAAQLCPGNRVRFRLVTLEEAQDALRRQEQAIRTAVTNC